MAEIYRIGSDDLIDRVSIFGGTNLALATNYDQFGINTYDIKTNVTFLGNNKVKIEAGGRLRRYANTIVNFPNGPRSFKGTLVRSIPIYENTLDTNAGFTVWYKTTATSGGGHGYSIPSQYTGFIYIIDTIINETSLYGFSLEAYATEATSGYIVIGPLKVEIGNKPTDWTPAPEDLVTYDSSNESLIFFQ